MLMLFTTDPPAPDFPGSYRPGLIEACSKIGSTDSAKYFPGSYRPGLIEAPNHRTATAIAASIFRGLTAPASLKLVVYGGPASLLPHFPGSYRPGLIEAFWDNRTYH